MPLPESCEFDVPALIWILALNVSPPSVLNAPQNCASSLGMPSVSPGPPNPRSFLQSYHTTAISPVVGSREIFRQELAVLSVVVIHADRSAPGLAVVVGMTGVDIHVVALTPDL